MLKHFEIISTAEYRKYRFNARDADAFSARRMSDICTSCGHESQYCHTEEPRYMMLPFVIAKRIQADDRTLIEAMNDEVDRIGLRMGAHVCHRGARATRGA